jgi:hypothetical protein
VEHHCSCECLLHLSRQLLPEMMLISVPNLPSPGSSGVRDDAAQDDLCCASSLATSSCAVGQQYGGQHSQAPAAVLSAAVKHITRQWASITIV